MNWQQIERFNPIIPERVSNFATEEIRQLLADNVSTIVQASQRLFMGESVVTTANELIANNLINDLSASLHEGRLRGHHDLKQIKIYVC